jgi:hypothetical protein
MISVTPSSTVTPTLMSPWNDSMRSRARSAAKRLQIQALIANKRIGSASKIPLSVLTA